MTNLAPEARPALGTLDIRAVVAAAFVLVVFAVVPWRHHGPERVVPSLDLVKQPPVIVAMELEPTPRASVLGALADLADLLAPTPWAVIDPPAHTDAQAWPRGMVIHPPPFPDGILDVQAVPGHLDRRAIDLPGALARVLDSVMSALTGRGPMTAS